MEKYSVLNLKKWGRLANRSTLTASDNPSLNIYINKEESVFFSEAFSK